MIYTLTLNPCLDYLIECNDIRLGKTNRSSSEKICFGGKGINVSFMLHELGEESVALGFVGGFTGNELEKLVNEKEIKTDFVKVSNGQTRINVKVKGENITEINASGFELCKEDLQKLYDKLSEVSEGDTVVMGGSAPKGAPDCIYEDICRTLSEKKAKLVVDTTGNKLLNCLKYKPYLIKPNKDELCELFGRSVDTFDEIAECARELQNLGAVNVLISMGGDGAILADEFGKIHKTQAHKIVAVNTVGAGDSMVAGFLKGAQKGCEYALKLGNACGGATAMCDGIASISVVNSLLCKE